MLANKLRILYIGNKLAVHGRTPTNIDTLGPLLEQEGYILFYSSNRKNKPLRLFDMLYSIWRYRKTIDIVLIDTYSTSAFYFAWLCGWWCHKLNIKYIPILHGGNLPVRFSDNPGMCRRLFGKSHINVCVSQYLLEYLEKDSFKGTVISNSIEIQNYPFKFRSTIQPNLLWVRAFHQTYNPQLAIEVLEMLCKEYPGAHLTMVGPELDDSMNKCKELVGEKKLAGNITFTGKLSKQEWIKLSTQCDVFINTSNYDNLPVSLLEAMALGLSVVSTDVGGIKYMIQHGVNGLLAEPANANALKDCMIRLLNDNNLAEAISKNGRNYAEPYDWHITKKQWQTLFNSIAVEPV